MYSKNVTVHQLLCLVLALGFTAPCFAQENTADTDKWFTADILKKTLFARTIEEKQFCDYVIQKRDDGTIPSRILYGVYQKAITKDQNRRFIYFKTALETVCQREGIVLNSTPVAPVSKTSTTPSFFLPSVFKGLFR